MDTITTFLHKNKSLLWPVIFWGWVAGVSFWIERIPVSNLSEETKKEQFSQFNFHGMRFEQLYLDGKQLLVSAPEAGFSGDEKILHLTRPSLKWSNPASDSVFSASADRGVLQVDVSDTSLPSEFNELTLIDNAHAVSRQATVDSQRMVFDNENTVVMVDGPSTYKSAQLQSQINDDRVFDPISNKILGSVEQVMAQREAAGINPNQ